MNLTIVRGLPGSGKSTYAKSLGCFRIEADMFHVHNGIYAYKQALSRNGHVFCLDMVKNAMQHHVDIVVSNTFTRQWEVAPYIDLAKSRGYDVTIVRMTKHYGNIHNVPDDTLKLMADRFEDIEGETLV